MIANTTHFPALDGLRALAAGSVILGHFAAKPLAGLVSFGDGGVIVFFVLSGFLITNILLRERESPRFALKAALKTFYIRRCLRIFPLYYAAILLCVLLGEPSVRERLASLVVFNLPGLPPVMGDYGSLAHFWSLFVEEQFYLIWPLLLWSVPRAWLLPVLIIVPLLSLTLKYSAALAGLEYRWIFNSVICCADHLGAGALLAYGMRRRAGNFSWLHCWWWLALLPVVLMSYFRIKDGIDAWYSGYLLFGAVMHSTWTLAGVALVAASLEPRRSLAWLTWPPLRLLGRISYGIYVYHFMVPFLQDRLSLGHMAAPGLEFGYKALLALVFAFVSWHVLESPFLALKDRLGRKEPLAPEPVLHH